MDHLMRTRLYELFLEPVAQRLERMWGFVRQSPDRVTETGTPSFINRTYRSSSTPLSSSSPQALTYCALPIAPGPLGPIA